MNQSEFTKFVIPAIINHFPDFIEFCINKPDEVVEINYPSKDGKLKLWLSTLGKELTIGFEDGLHPCWHTHMELLEANTPEEELKAAVKLIDQIIEDKTVIVYSSELGYYLADNIAEVYEDQAEDEEIKLLYWSEL